MQENNKNNFKIDKVIGIAGGIGSGKSTVTDYLRSKSYLVIDADEEAREAVNPGEPTLDELVDYFGSHIIQEDGTLNRRKLAQIAFSDPEKTKKLNDILHKDISIRIDKKLTQNAGRGQVAFISAPLFFEADLQKKCNETWAVVADKDVRIKRTMERDNLPKEEVVDRINRQMSDDEREKLADYVLFNNGSKEELIKQVDQLMINA